MHAQAGDWLVVESRTTGGQRRRAQILATKSTDGQAPFTVRWLDSGREALVFPGPDSHVVTAEEQAEHDRKETARILKAQSAITNDTTHH